MMGKVDSSHSKVSSNTGLDFNEEEDMTSNEFTTFFRDIHDQEPFPWQHRLTTQVLNRGIWPKVIDLPTGTGKTAVLDTAVFVLAARPAIFPRRIVFVIDRRIVVDQVYKRAQQIRDRIEGGHSPILLKVRDRLRALSDGKPLGIAALRGGIPIDNEWTHRPDQPWVMVSTIDQFGSRLLFRGYGVTPGMRPIHAGLAGNDCLVILDEVHLSVPFAETLAQVAELNTGTLPRRYEVVEMSATPNDEEADRFTLDPVADLSECKELRRRVNAVKKAELVDVESHGELPSAVTRLIKSINNSKPCGRICSVGVVVNRVRVARETHQALEEAGYKTYLITGRMRPLDRIDILDRIAPAVDPDSEQLSDTLTVVVATQAIEVGADFSFDALITECAAVDSLRQRFGRLDRRGNYFASTGVAARAWIIGPKSVVASSKPDPIYGGSAKITWKELKRRAESGPVDVSPFSLMDFPNGAIAPKASAPLLLDTYMDAWTQTNPEPIVQPSVEWFLHGIDHDRTATPDVSILWRLDMTSEVLRLVPPRQAEFLQVPIDAAKSWLSSSEEVDVTDITQMRIEGNDSYSSLLGNAEENGCLRWEGFGKIPNYVGVDEIRPGDILIVDPNRGGLKAGSWDPSSTMPVTDLGDVAQVVYGRIATMRLDPRLTNMISMPLPADEVDANFPARVRISQWLNQWVSESDSLPDWISETIGRLDSNFDYIAVGLNDESSGNGYYILTERHTDTGRPVVDAATMDGSDESGSLIGTGVTLGRHLDGVGIRAGKIAERLGLDPGIVNDIRLAGRLHDLGKVDSRFQEQLVGGDLVALEMLNEPLAKSLPGVRRTWRYPTGMRHEVASVAMIESNKEVLSAANDKDLVLHLVGTHHGWGRPLLPIIEDPEPQMLTYKFDGHAMTAYSDLEESSLALEMADRFWRLVGRYGYHGLAWLETILRLADHQQSARESEQL